MLENTGIIEPNMGKYLACRVNAYGVIQQKKDSNVMLAVGSQRII